MPAISMAYADYRLVQKVLAELQNAGVPLASTSLVARDADERYRSSFAQEPANTDRLFGAQIGGAAGICVGVLIAVATLESDPLDPVFLASCMAISIGTGMAGAFCGWLLGTLLSSPVARPVGSGSGTILTVETDDEHAALVERIMRNGIDAAPPQQKSSEDVSDAPLSPALSLVEAPRRRARFRI